MMTKSTMMLNTTKVVFIFLHSFTAWTGRDHIRAQLMPDIRRRTHENFREHL